MFYKCVYIFINNLIVNYYIFKRKVTLTVLRLLELIRTLRSYNILAYRWSMLFTSSATKYSVRFL